MITHKKLQENFFEGKKILDIGCGRNKISNSTGLDQNQYDGVDIIANLEEKLPIPNETFDLVFANQVLEHIIDLDNLLMEIHRVLRPGGQLLAHVPYFRSSWAYIDPTHKRFFTLNTLDYYVVNTWFYNNYRFTDIGFSKIEKFLDTDYKSSLARKLFTSFALKNPQKFENSLLSFVFPFEQLSFKMTK
jgi:ubiquinone/menaquinone biosynthesis C-methylase UbiE